MSHEAKDDGWIEWKGGECPPVEVDTHVEVKLRTGDVFDSAAGYYDWRHENIPEDILAYRVLS